jgi:hypothetical protein
MLRGAVFGDKVVELTPPPLASDVEQHDADEMLAWLDDASPALAAQPSDASAALALQLAQLVDVTQVSGDAPAYQSYDEVRYSTTMWIRQHGKLPISMQLGADTMQCMLTIGSGKGMGALLIDCDENWRAFSVAATKSLEQFASPLAKDVRARCCDPVRCLSRCVALAHATLVTDAVRNPPDEPADSLEISLFVRQALPQAVDHMISVGRPKFEIAERVRLIRKMVETARTEEAERSIVQDMFNGQVPPQLYDLMVRSRSRSTPFGRAGGDLFVHPSAAFGNRGGGGGGGGGGGSSSEYLLNGTRAGRQALQREIEFIQKHSKEFDSLGIEVRLTGNGRAAPPSIGASNAYQGSDLYRWTVWLYGFGDAAVQRRQWRLLQRDPDSAPGDSTWFDVPDDLVGELDLNDEAPNRDFDQPPPFVARSNTFAAELATYNQQMSERTTFQILKRTLFRRPQVQLELRFDDSEAMPAAPMIRVISPALLPLASASGAGISEDGSLLSASQEGAVFEMGADGKLRRGARDAEGKEANVLSASVAFETSGGWETEARMRDVLVRLWCWLAGAGARVDVPASLDPAGGMPTEGGFWRVLRCLPPTAVDGATGLEETGKVILPASCLETLVDPNNDQGGQAIAGLMAFTATPFAASQERATAPMLFELSRADGGHRRTFAGVAEFTAPEGVVIVPLWLQANAALEPNMRCSVRRVQLPRGTHLRLRPHDDAFLKDGDAKAQLEWRLPSYPALTRGDVLQLGNGAKLDVLDVKPGRSVLVIDADIEVDFAAPLGSTAAAALPDAGGAPIDATSTSVFGSAAPAAVAPATQPAAPATAGGATVGAAADGVPCPNCRRLVPPGALAMHQLRCERTNYFCVECSEVVAIADKQKHVDAKHVPIDCHQCKGKLMRRDLQAHLANTCAMRVVRCEYFEYCGIRVPACDMATHRLACGEKTELCDSCNERVPRKRFDSHLMQCLSSRDLPSPPSDKPRGVDVGGGTVSYEDDDDLEEEDERTSLGRREPLFRRAAPTGAGDMMICPICQHMERFLDDLQVHMLIAHDVS